MLAKNVNDNARFLNERGAFEFFASKLAPTGGLWCSPYICLLRWICSLASFTTFSTVNPNFSCNLASGAEAPKLFITTLAPVCPT